MSAPLTPEEQATVTALLENPPAKDQYVWSEDFQRVIVGLLLCDRYFLTQVVGLVEPRYFVNEIHQHIARVVFEYFQEYHQQPSKVMVRERLLEYLRQRYQQQPKEKLETVSLLYLGETNTIYDYYTQGGVGELVPALDSSEAVLKMVTSFAKATAFRFAFLRSLELVKKSPTDDATYTSIDELYKAARLVDRKHDLGLNYFETIQERYARLLAAEESAEAFTMGFTSIDRELQGGGLVRGELFAIMAESGVGKSLCLAVICVKNILQGKRVLYLSTEMDPDRVALRFDSNFSRIGQHELLARKEEVWGHLHNQVKNYEDHHRLVIKQFPSGMVDFAGVQAYFSQIVMNGFRPDMVILDYPGDMKLPTNRKKYETLQEIQTQFRGMATEEKFVGGVAVQPNRGAAELGIDEFLTAHKQGDAYGQIRVFDLFVTINQTNHERNAEVGRFYVDKARNGRAKYWFYTKFGYKDKTLLITEIGKQDYRTLMERATDQAADETAADVDRIVVAHTGGEPA